MADIYSDGKGSFITWDGNNWVPTAAPDTKQLDGGNRFTEAPPEEAKPPPSSQAPGQGAFGGNATIDPVSGAEIPPPETATAGEGSQQVARGASMVGDLIAHPRVDTSIKPGPNVADMLPLSQDPASGRLSFALPNPVRAMLTEGPQIDQGQLKTPAVTAVPGDDGSVHINLTPEAQAAGQFAGGVVGSPVRFSGANTLMRGPPATFGRPLPVTINELMAAMDRADQPPPGAPQAAQPAPPPPPAARPPAADPAIMTPAEIQARARGYYSPADQAAAANAVLPDANAGAVRKLFRDAVPSDPEQARIAANQPAVQAAKNVDATGPMSFDTAMLLDRDLTDRMRGSRGQDVHDLSELQKGLRTQMDQVPDLDHLRPARQAYTQYIKQSQMDDINYGASLKNDPAAADAYVRQRAAALLKNDSAMRNWSPEETAALERVARSGDIGMLGRLSVSLVKPIVQAVGAGAGTLLTGGSPWGAVVGAHVGSDVGATQASKLRGYLSKTTLDPVMQQITQGVPPAPRNTLLQ
jgi:hypothetical protein